MNILFLTKYGNLAASSRLRAYQYKSKMDPSKFDIDVKPLLSNRYLDRKFNNKRISIFYLIFLFFKRIFTLINIAKYDVVIIHLELFPFLPPVFEWLLFKSSKKIYFDYDDAIYHNYDMSNNYFIRLFLSSKIRYLMRMADGVIAGNHYTENYAINSGATNILELPTVIDIDTYMNEPLPSKLNDSFTVGWIGSPSTSRYLEIVKDALSRLGEIVPVTLYVVGANKNLNLSIDNVQLISNHWSEENEKKALAEFDVGIMPLYDEPWEKGKCAFKLIQYMASFLPVVSSNVGMNAEIIHNRGNGLLATNTDEWFESLYRIYSDRDMRKVMGKNGRELIERDFTIQSRLSDFEEFITAVKKPVGNFQYQADDKIEDIVDNLNSYSVITICLDCESTIKRTIDSVLIQNILPKQYIFVLGCSKDKSEKILLSYRSRIEDKGVEFILIKEKVKVEAGIPVAWNLGIGKVESDIVAILNADDYYISNNTILTVLENFRKKEGCLIVSGRILYTNTIKTQSNRSERLFPFLNPYNHPATFIAKKLYDEIGQYNTSYIVSADYDFLYRAYSLGYKFFIDNNILVSMEPGGFASQNKEIGRAEAYKIATSYTKTNFLPGLALVLRFVLRK